MKLKVYKHSHDVPTKYHKTLRKLHLKHGSIHWTFFDDVRSPRNKSNIHEVVIVLHNDVPVAWGLMCKGDSYSYKNAMFYTSYNYRRQGLASMIYSSMCERHKKFIVFPSYKNKKFFESCGRNIRDY